MLRKKYITLLLMGMAALMLLAATEVMAGCPAPTSCDFVDKNGNPSGYSITLDSITQDTCYVDEEPFTCYKWVYKWGGPTSTTNQVSILAPLCCPEVGYPDFSGGQVNQPGTGEPRTYFGVGNFQDYVIRLAYNTSSKSYSFYTAKQTPYGVSSMQVTSGKNTYYCKAIAAPDCPRPGQIPSIVQKNLVIEGMHVKLWIDDNQCVQDAWMCDDNFNNCIMMEAVTITATDADGQTSTVREISDLDGNQRCAWGRIYLADSPGCTLIPNGAGGFYKVGDTCKCRRNSQCYTPAGYTCCKPSGSDVGYCQTTCP